MHLLKETTWDIPGNVLLPSTNKVIAVKGINYYADLEISASTPDIPYHEFLLEMSTQEVSGMGDRWF